MGLKLLVQFEPPRKSVARLLRIVGLLFLAGLLPLPAVGAGFRGDRDLLELVAKQYKANRESIRTWHGKVEMALTTTVAKKGKTTSRNSRRMITFACDRAADKYMFLAHRLEASGQEPARASPEELHWGAIRTSDGLFKIAPWAEAAAKRGRVATIYDRPTLVVGSPTNRRRGDFSPHFDPFWYLEDSGMEMSQRLMEFHKVWGNQEYGATTNISVSRDKNLITFEIERPKVLLSRQVFDLDQGANLVQITSWDSALSADHHRTFAKVSGVWVPLTCVVKQSSRTTGDFQECRVNWLESTVNGTIPSNTFSLARVGVKPGDWVTDKRVHNTYRYDPDHDLPEVAAKSTGWTRYWVAAIACGALGVLLFGWRIWRHRRAKEAGHGQSA